MNIALDDPEIRSVLHGRRVTLVAAGKVAAPMATAFLGRWDGEMAGAVAAGTVGSVSGFRCDWFAAGHPIPTEGSEAAGRQVLELAGRTSPEDVLLLLLSGGASACLAVPIDGVTLEDKVAATRALLRGGVAIDGINCVRKHLSAIKGGRLALATPGMLLTLAISDVVGPIPDDPAVIGSGPTAGDPTTFGDAIAVAEQPSVRLNFPATAMRALERGRRRELTETPAPGDPRLVKSKVRVIGNGAVAVKAAEKAAAALGYAVTTIDAPVVGDARTAAIRHFHTIVRVAKTLSRPACVISSGETTVEVTGSGRGGRNQEFALAMVEDLARGGTNLVLASVGTDGVDGPTDAAGAVVDETTLARAVQEGIGTPATYLASNDSYAFFDKLDDLVRTGPTDTNVGDLQVALISDARG